LTGVIDRGWGSRGEPFLNDGVFAIELFCGLPRVMDFNVVITLRVMTTVAAALPVYLSHDDVDGADDGGDVGDQAARANLAGDTEVRHA
jgi:hypothetical protein